MYFRRREVEIVKIVFKDLEITVKMIDKGNHTPFVEFPGTVMQSIMRFSDQWLFRMQL